MLKSNDNGESVISSMNFVQRSALALQVSENKLIL